MLMDVFKAAMQRKSIKDSDPYDWEKENSEEESIAVLQQNLKQTHLNTHQGPTSNGIMLNQTSTNKNNLGATMAPGSALSPFGDMNLANNNNNNINYKDSNLMEPNSEKNRNLVSNGLTNGNETQSQLQQKRARNVDQNGESKSARNQLESSSFKGPAYQQIPIVPNNNTPNMNNNNLNMTNLNNNKLANGNASKQPATTNQQVPQSSNTAAAIAAAAAVQAAASIQAGATSTNSSYQMSLQAQNRNGSNMQQQQQQQQHQLQQQSSSKLRNLSSRNREESQASISCGSESNKNSRQFLLGTPQHQPIIKNQKQQQVTSSGLQSYPSATPTTTAGIALMQNNNKTSMANNNNNNNNAGSSQATNSCYTNNYARQASNAKGFNLNNSMDYTTPIGKLLCIILLFRFKS